MITDERAAPFSQGVAVGEAGDLEKISFAFVNIQVRTGLDGCSPNGWGEKGGNLASLPFSKLGQVVTSICQPIGG